MSIKYAIHVSDIQVKKMSRHADFKACFDNFFKILNEKVNEGNKHEFICVITGDVFHNKIDISNEQQMLIKEFITKISDLMTVILIAGNHDFLVNNKQRLDSLTPVIESVNRENVHYLKESKIYPIENIAFVNYSIFEDNKKPEGLEEFKEENKDKNYKYVGLYHSMLSGSINHNDFKFDRGDSIDIFDGLDMVMCGDIHKYQTVPGPIPIVYAGSMIQQHVGERLSDHGFVIWHLEKLKYDIVEVPNEYTYVKVEIKGIKNLEELKIVNE